MAGKKIKLLVTPPLAKEHGVMGDAGEPVGIMSYEAKEV